MFKRWLRKQRVRVLTGSRVIADRGSFPGVKEAQIALMLKYRQILEEGRALPLLRNTEFRTYSQNCEDGLLLYIFSLIGMGGRRSVEVCAGNGIECNSANLIIHHGWQSLLVDGNSDLIYEGQQYYARHPNTRRTPPKLLCSWITCETINRIIQDNGFNGDLDLLVIDMDGVDYWIWKAIDVVKPRLVVLEYNNRWPESESVSVPYAPDFVTKEHPGPGNLVYFGASLGAFHKLANEKGYRLIGANSENTNAFFLRNSVDAPFFQTVSVAECLSSPFARESQARWFTTLSKMPLEQV